MSGQTILIICGLILVNVLLWLVILPWYVNRINMRFQNKLINRHYDEVETMYRKMRGWRHDYHNHLQSLKAYLSLGQYEEAARYLEGLEEDLSTVDSVLKTGNIVADAILNSKLTLIQERQISVDATAVVPGDIPVSEIDLSVLIGNLLDNAMEACMQLPEKERFIRIYIDIVRRQLYISVTNSMAGRGGKGGEGFRTRKRGNHGFGLVRIDSIVKKYGGYINRQTDEGVFATEVTLPLAEL